MKLAVSNLIAHRVRNRKTFVMYALALAFIVFITVSANQQIQVASYNQMKSDGASITCVCRLCSHGILSSCAAQQYVCRVLCRIDGWGYDWERFERIESVLAASNVSSKLLGHSWSTAPLHSNYAAPNEMEAAVSCDCCRLVNQPVLTAVCWGVCQSAVNLGRVYSARSVPIGIMPTLFDSWYSQFFTVGSRGSSSLSIASQLYTARGSQGVRVCNVNILLSCV